MTDRGSTHVYPVSLALICHDGKDDESIPLCPASADQSILVWTLSRLSHLFSELLVVISNPHFVLKYREILSNLNLPVRLIVTRLDVAEGSGFATSRLIEALRAADCGWVMALDSCRPLMSFQPLVSLLNHIYVTKRLAQVPPVAFYDIYANQPVPLPSLWPKAIATVLEIQNVKTPQPIQWFLANLNTVFYDGRSYLRENPYRFATEDDAKRFFATRHQNFS
jgi:hypothetical protein